MQTSVIKLTAIHTTHLLLLLITTVQMTHTGIVDAWLGWSVTSETLCVCLWVCVSAL